MSFWKKLFKRPNKYRNIDEVIDEELRMEEEDYVLSIDQIDMKSAGDRERYVLSLLEQIADASAQIESCKEEYNTVNRYLKDMEDLEYIRGDDRNSLMEYAKAISLLEKDKHVYEEKKQRLKDEDFIRMEKLEENAEEGIRKLTEAEEYQQAIRSDMMRLENEKQACLFRKQEAAAAMENLRGMALICTVALFACMGMLLFMQFVLEMNATIGYFLTASVAAIALTAMYMKYVEAVSERKRSSHSLNKVICYKIK